MPRKSTKKTPMLRSLVSRRIHLNQFRRDLIAQSQSLFLLMQSLVPLPRALVTLLDRLVSQRLQAIERDLQLRFRALRSHASLPLAIELLITNGTGSSPSTIHHILQLLRDTSEIGFPLKVFSFNKVHY
jgi:hypothetical protein